MVCPDFYESYYCQQAGSGLPVYGGVAVQKGHGLGSILSGLFRTALPVLKKVGATVGKEALKGGLDVASDVMGGDSLKQSLKRRARERGQSFLGRVASGKVIPPRRKRRKSGFSASTDIFAN